ncbi:hypothetical protein SUSP_001244 [Sulfurospirillum sp. 'SP']|nr:hypothetical protein [Sulfurospirillum sp. 'SP']WNY98735.1 hypothetical protein SUSP_001153 [Sulfurospirillum sp. 'SP']WNY98826.1 hypothetical protein SUSP_001244 [Sulfurospirillum sp. 'SP']
MNFSVSLELLLTLVVQFVVIISFFVSMRERVKRLETDVIKLWEVQDEAKEKHELIARIDAKLDLLLTQISQKQG